MGDAERRLEAAYGGPLPPGLAALSEPDRQRLADAIDAAGDRQRRALAAATDRGLGFVPKVLRGPVTRVLSR